MSTPPSRRDFLRIAAGAAAAGPTLLNAQSQQIPPPAFEDVPPNERIQFATFGLGSTVILITEPAGGVTTHVSRDERVKYGQPVFTFGR